MIKFISSSSPNLVVYSGSASMPYINMSNVSAGMMRYNGNNSCIEVYDGSTWQMLQGGSATVDMTGPANDAIIWAQKKMVEEKTWEKLAETNEAVKIALENLNKAREQLDITAKLARDYDQTTS